MEALRKSALIKRAYVRYLTHARSFGKGGIEQVQHSIGHLEDYLDADFDTFNSQVAIDFKSFLHDVISEKTGEPLSSATISKICRNNAQFLEWLARQTEFEPRFSANDAAYLNPTATMREVVRRKPIVSIPDIGDFVRAVQAMPYGTVFEKRNRAAMATLLLSGARADALASLRLRSLDLEKKLVDQDGTLVRTKRKKRIVSWFFPVGADMLEIVEDWLRTLSSLGYAGVDPLFPADKRVVGRDGLLVSTGLSKNVWESAMPVRKFFKKMCEDAGIPCNHPHAIRRSLVKLAFRSPYTIEQLKCWSQNLGHSNIETTVLVYGEIPDWRREEIMREVWDSQTKAKNASPNGPVPHLEPIVAVLRAHGYSVSR